ncbi:MAG: ABC transporter permease [Salinigranum sp.]
MTARGDRERRSETERGGSADDGARFEEIDWDELDRETRRRPSTPTLAFLAGVVAVVAAYGADALAGPSGRPPAVPFTPVDALFAVTLLAAARYGLYPLAAEPRVARRYWRTFRRNRVAVWSLGFLAVVFVVGLLGPLVVARPELDVLARYQPPVFGAAPTTVTGPCVGRVSDGVCHGTWAHPLGTTGQGKDVLASVVYGTRVSLEVGLVTASLVAVIGTAVGTTAAYAGGLVDEALMRYVDVQMTFPTFFLYLLLLYLYGGTLFLLVVIFGVTSWGGTARLVRSEALQRRTEPYVEAARVAGASELRIVRRHVLPNVSNTVITNATLLVPSLVLFEATFAFLGLGDPTVPSWGRLIAAGRGDLASAWWISTIPGVVLFATVLALNFVGDATRDALDPRGER